MTRAEKQSSYYFRPHVLIVDDDVRICGLLSRFLLDQGMVVLSAHDAQQAQNLLDVHDFDVCVLDIMMPGQDGLGFAQDLRKDGIDLPVIFLTALSEMHDKISGFDAGGDDYVTKPFEPQELLLRLRAILRRTLSRHEENSRTLFLGTLRFNLLDGELKNNEGQGITLTDSERELLLVMARNAGQVMSRDILAEQCGGASVRAIDVQVTRLRKKIEPDSKAPKIIQTIRGQGYVLRAKEAPETE